MLDELVVVGQDQSVTVGRVLDPVVVVDQMLHVGQEVIEPEQDLDAGEGVVVDPVDRSCGIVEEEPPAGLVGHLGAAGSGEAVLETAQVPRRVEPEIRAQVPLVLVVDAPPGIVEAVPFHEMVSGVARPQRIEAGKRRGSGVAEETGGVPVVDVDGSEEAVDVAVRQMGPKGLVQIHTRVPENHVVHGVPDVGIVEVGGGPAIQFQTLEQDVAGSAHDDQAVVLVARRGIWIDAVQGPPRRVLGGDGPAFPTCGSEGVRGVLRGSSLVEGRHARREVQPGTASLLGHGVGSPQDQARLAVDPKLAGQRVVGIRQNDLASVGGAGIDGGLDRSRGADVGGRSGEGRSGEQGGKADRMGTEFGGHGGSPRDDRGAGIPVRSSFLQS